MFHVKQLQEVFVQAGLEEHVPGGFFEAAATHLDMVYRWNKVHDLTAVAAADAPMRHVLDSILPFTDLAAVEKVLDVGSGAGFPGIPLALWWPSAQLHLCEPLRKRRSFLEQVCGALDLNTVLLEQPVEKLIGASFDMVTSRATLAWDALLESAWPLLKPGGILVALCGPENTPTGPEVLRYTLPNGAQRTRVMAKKHAT